MIEEYKRFIENIVRYGECSVKIYAIIIIGSYARQGRQADNYSDLDLILIVDEPDFFIKSDDWLEKIGIFHISFIENTITGGKERRILFDNALDVDFIPIPKNVSCEMIERAKPILERGYKVILDKIGIAETLPLINEKSQSYKFLNENDYINIVNDFWYHAVWSVKKLNRGEMWTAKFCFDSYMKWKLLAMIEYHSQIKNGNDYYTWYNGRFLENWAEQWILDELSTCFSHYEKEDMKSALLNTMNLFRSIAVDIAETQKYCYPLKSDEYVTGWVKANLKA
jgi:aminoglycoside 6-adenylyltransferase